MKAKVKQILQIEKVQAALIIFASMVVFFYPVFLKGEVIVSDVYMKFSPYDDLREGDFNFDSDLRSDMIDSYYPRKKLFFDSIKNGEFPYWENNLKFGSVTTTILDYYFPLDYFSLLIPLQYVLTLTVLLKVFVSGLCTYLLLRTLKLKHISSLFGSLIYIYSGFNVVWFWNNAGTTGYLLPVFLLGTLKILEGKTSYALLIIYTSALLLFTGFIAGAGYVSYLACLFTIAYFFKEINEKYRKLFSLKKPEERFISLVQFGERYYLLLCSVLLGLSFTLFVLIPTINYLNLLDVHSYRSATNSKYYLDFETSFPQLIIPYYNRGPLITGFLGAANYNESTGYIGLIGLVFFLIGLFFGVKQKKWWVLWAMFVNLLAISVVFKIGPALEILNELPIFDSSSNTRLLMWVCFSASLISAYGFDQIKVIFDYFNKNKKRALRALSAIFMLLIILGIWLIVKLSKVDFEAQKQEVTPEFYRLVVLAVSIFLMSGFSMLVVLISYKGWRLRVMTFVICILVFVELFIYGLKQISTLPNNLFYPETEGIEFLKENTANGERIMAFDGTFALRGTEAYFDLPIINDHSLYSEKERIKLRELYKSEDLMWMSRTSPRNEPNNVIYDSPKMDEFNIKYLVFTPEQEFNYDSKKALEENFAQVFYKPDDLKIYENKGGYSLVHSNNPNAQIEIVELSNNSEKFKIKTDAPTLFYVSESYHPNWTATINDKDAKVFEYDNLYKAVNVGEGESVVSFEYKPEKIYKYGLIYTLSANLLIILLIIGRFFDLPRVIKEKLHKDRKDQQ